MSALATSRSTESMTSFRATSSRPSPSAIGARPEPLRRQRPPTDRKIHMPSDLLVIRHSQRLLLAVLFILAASGHAVAQDTYPAASIRIIVPFTPGTGID